MSGAGLADHIAVHATGVAIGSRALLILGRSRAGKSRTACALIGLSRPNRPIRLIGDDRILLRVTRHGVLARPHPRIAGFIEKRGLGPSGIPHTKLTADALSKAIGVALNDQAMRKRAANTGAQVRAENGIARAAGIIERAAAKTAA